MIGFVDDDGGYMAWLTAHPGGFVVNVRSTAGPGYAVLHRAGCRFIYVPRDDRAYTGRGYRKVVSDDIDDLRAFARSIGRWDGSFSQVCGHCAPL
ncbi:hypothetical protein HGI47_21845 [Novosphingobium sp. ERN07]|uniref:hypothetical protein n=1 Tax=Novosphingobium sp. ERN07 TaxID=2726187 RepID=UPI00145663CD|nr:hypothetical protein [Novosphingobium sp. ERN07]NLR73497.1 hypothetical protein [Novosphingobium sp. ERN07]